MSNLKNLRIETLDWLRGLMALSIMFYHLSIWLFPPIDSTQVLGRLGIYGVSIFFVLSGLSMAIVYNVYIGSLRTSINFYLRRIFRIWPLLWIACILTVIPQVVKTGSMDWGKLFLNFTTLFGFIKPSGYIPVGAWSIGNEMVYYAFTPFIFFLYNYKKWMGDTFFMICVCVGLFFAFDLLNQNITLADQWTTYINPFNNLFLYVMGISMYYNFRNININPLFNILLLILAISLFCFLPYEGNQILIVSGFGRIVFVLLSYIIVLCFFKLRINLPKILSNTLETFGVATYGVYIIHPIMYIYLNSFIGKFGNIDPILLFGLVSILTISMAVISYRLFEIRLIKVGKKLTANKTRF